MSRTEHSARRLLTAGVAILVLAPLLGAVHQHGVGHSGAILHIERDHGGHEHEPPELVDRQISHGFSLLAVPAVAWTLPDAAPSHPWTPSAESIEYSARPPPPSIRSRAPPPFSL